MNSKRQRQSSFSQPDRALVEAVKQDVLTELSNRERTRPNFNQPYQLFQGESYYPDRMLVETVKQQVLVQLEAEQEAAEEAAQQQFQSGTPHHRGQSPVDPSYHQMHYAAHQSGFHPPYAVYGISPQPYPGSPAPASFNSYQPYTGYYPQTFASPAPALVEAVKREILAQLPANREAPEPMELDEQQPFSPYPYPSARNNQPNYPGSPNIDPYLVEMIKQDVLIQLQSRPQPMAQ